MDKEERKKEAEYLWYIWKNKNSPVYGKWMPPSRGILAAPETHVEQKNPYYAYVNEERVIDRILAEFSLDPENSHIVNGHMPVKVAKGETPIKCNGKLFIIDGGFSKAYQKVTGIAIPLYTIPMWPASGGP